MTHAEINIGYACNSRCVFCVSGEAASIDRRFASLAKIRKEIAGAYTRGARSLGFLGGEATIHPALAEAVGYAAKTGFRRIVITTNGIALADKGMCERLVVKGVTRFSVSLHSHSARTEDVLTGGGGNFAKKVKAIRNLVALRRRGAVVHGVSVNAVIHARNYRDLRQLALLGKRLGIDDMRFNFIRVEGRAKERLALVPSLPAAAREAEALIRWNERTGKAQITFGGVPLCFFRRACGGDIALLGKYAGEFRDMLTEVSLLAAIDRKRFDLGQRRTKRHNMFLPQCRVCDLIHFCNGVPRDYFLAHRSDSFAQPFTVDR